jgi:hypothetical protein
VLLVLSILAITGVLLYHSTSYLDYYFPSNVVVIFLLIMDRLMATGDYRNGQYVPLWPYCQKRYDLAVQGDRETNCNYVSIY